MNRIKKDNSKNFESSLNDYYDILTSNSSRIEALKAVASEGMHRFGEFVTPGSLKLRDEIQINFVEILDQIIFELGENSDSGAEIRYYIMEDLYSRMSLTLEALVDMDKYLAGLKNRTFYYDDFIVIRNRRLSGLVPILLEEAEDITNLEKQIIKTLLYFPDEAAINYFYNSFRNSSSGFTRSAALLGIRYCNMGDNGWSSPKKESEECAKSIEYMKTFSFENLAGNRLPATREEMTFALLHIEKEAASVKDSKTVSWILSMLELIPFMNFENSWSGEIIISSGNILLNLDLNLVRDILKNDSILAKAVNFIDFLPRNIFNRLTGQLDMLGMEFLFKLNSMIEKRSKGIDSCNSNILTYLSWNSTEIF